jgi:hypothetical protein
MKQSYPSLRVLAWIGIPLKTLSGGYADLHDPQTRAVIARVCTTLTDYYTFDGVQLDPETVGNEDADLLQLLREVRGEIPANKMLSLATPAIYPIFAEASVLRVAGFPYWSATYYREVSGLVDQIAVMSYDSTLTAAWQYQQWLRFQAINLTHALRDWQGELYIGVPVSEEKTATHFPDAENIKAAFAGLEAGVNYHP